MCRPTTFLPTPALVLTVVRSTRRWRHKRLPISVVVNPTRIDSLFWSSISLSLCKVFFRLKTRRSKIMGEPYVGEIRIFAGSFAPAGWAMCQGQTMPISENDTLFNLIGTTYGGDRPETFQTTAL